MLRPPPIPTLFPYTTLFRSTIEQDHRRAAARSESPRRGRQRLPGRSALAPPAESDRKSTRLNSSHVAISYAVFCLKKKKINKIHRTQKMNIGIEPYDMQASV